MQINYCSLEFLLYNHTQKAERLINFVIIMYPKKFNINYIEMEDY